MFVINITFEMIFFPYWLLDLKYLAFFFYEYCFILSSQDIIFFLIIVIDEIQTLLSYLTITKFNKLGESHNSSDKKKFTNLGESYNSRVNKIY